MGVGDSISSGSGESVVEDLSPREAAHRLVRAHREQDGWLDRFAAELDQQRVSSSLSRILSVWQLSQSDAARLFGVSRQAVAKWMEGNLPAERAVAVADLAAATDLLVRYLERDRIPAVVRRSAAALGGESLMQLLGRGETRLVLEACRNMFDFAKAHG
jgi:predicted transcriptional regulator